MPCDPQNKIAIGDMVSRNWFQRINNDKGEYGEEKAKLSPKPTYSRRSDITVTSYRSLMIQHPRWTKHIIFFHIHRLPARQTFATPKEGSVKSAGPVFTNNPTGPLQDTDSITSERRSQRRSQRPGLIIKLTWDSETLDHMMQKGPRARPCSKKTASGNRFFGMAYRGIVSSVM